MGITHKTPHYTHHYAQDTTRNKLQFSCLVLLYLGVSIASENDQTLQPQHSSHKKIEDLIAGEDIDGSDYENVDENDQEEKETNSLIWILILLGVFNHIIVPMFCIGKKQNKDKIEETTMRVNEIKNGENIDDKIKTEGNHNEAFEDLPETTLDTDNERIQSIKNENFDKTLLNKISDNQDHTNTPGISLEDGEENYIEPSIANNEKVDLAMKNNQEVKEAQAKADHAQINEFTSDKFRPREKNSCNIEIEDGNIKKFVEGPPGGKIATIEESNQE